MMNTRIQQLMEQSGLQPYYNGQEVDIAKFAELLIQECIVALQNNANNLTLDDRIAAIEEIEDHFGVNE